MDPRLLQIEAPEPSQPERDAMNFPEPHMQGAKIVDIHLTADFFIFVTDVSLPKDFYIFHHCHAPCFQSRKSETEPDG